MSYNELPSPISAEQNFQQRQAEDAYQDQRYFNRKNADAHIQAQKEIAVYKAKQEIAAQCAMIRQEQKQWLKQYESDLRKNSYEEIALTTEGNITAILQNQIESRTVRTIANIKNPKLDRLIHLEQPEEFVFALSADLGKQRCFVYLDGANIGNVNYLLKKFTARGIFFYTDVSAQQKIYARMLICFLLAREPENVYIPENSGWAYFPDEGFSFTGEEEMIWKTLVKLTK